MLSEYESKRLLATYGLPVTKELVADSVRAAVDAAGDIGMPVAVKASGAALAHKTERNLVRLGLTDEAAVAAAATELLDATGEVLVAEMVAGRRELIAGVTDDEQWGLTIMVGFGGILAEAVGDVSFRLAPIGPADARSMLDELDTQALLGPFRGEPAADRDAIVGCLTALSDAATSIADVASIDVNPLVLCDGRPVAVDAVVTTR